MSCVCNLQTSTADHVLPIYIGILSREEAKGLMCLAEVVDVQTKIHAYEPPKSLN